jgi:cell division transport system permease protein
MSFISCAIIMAALIILGVFFLIILNIDSNLRILGEKPQIKIYCRYDLGEEEIFALEDEIRQVQGIREFVYVAKDEAFLRAKDLLGEEAGILDGLGPEFLPVSFIVKMDDPELIEGFVQKVVGMEGVDKVDYPKKVIDFISGVSRWVKLFGIALVSIPMLFSVFIISNTIRLAVSERSGEIGIMRYIGATENIIKWPFVVEGVLMGALGAAFAFMLTNYGYSFVERGFSLEVAGVSDNFFVLEGVGAITARLLALDLAFGMCVGAAGSAQAIRRHLRA